MMNWDFVGAFLAGALLMCALHDASDNKWLDASISLAFCALNAWAALS